MNNETFVGKILEDWRTKGFHEEVFYNLYKSRIAAVLAGKKPVPYEIEIQPSAKCNAFCEHCWAGVGKNSADQKLQDNLEDKQNMDKIIDEILEFKDGSFNVEIVKFCGATGEPLMNPLTLHAINRLYGKKKLRLFSNGILIAMNRNNEEYLKTLAKVDRINLSLDAGTTETMHNIKRGSREVKLEDILECIRKIKGFSEGKCKIEISYVITDKNYFEIDEAAKKAKTYGADSFRVRLDFIGKEMTLACREVILDKSEKVRNYGDDNFNVFFMYNTDDFEEGKEKKSSSKDFGYKCFTSRFWVSIGPDGNVYPCGHITLKGTKHYGSLLKKSFRKIWDGKEREEAIGCLPGNKCYICSPFSLTINRKMNEFQEKMLEYVEMSVLSA